MKRIRDSDSDTVTVIVSGSHRTLILLHRYSAMVAWLSLLVLLCLGHLSFGLKPFAWTLVDGGGVSKTSDSVVATATVPLPCSSKYGELDNRTIRKGFAPHIPYIPYVPVRLQNSFRRLSSRLTRNTHRLISGTINLVPTMFESRRLKSLRKHSGDKAITFSQYKFIERCNGDLMKIITLSAYRYILGPKMSFSFQFLTPMFSSSPWAWSAFPASYNNVSFDEEVRDRVLVNRRRNYLLSILVQTNRNFLDNNVGAIEDSILADRSTYEYTTVYPNEKVYNMSNVADAVRISKHDIRKSLSLVTPLFETKPSNSRHLHINTNIIPHHVLKDFSRCVSGEGTWSFVPIVRWANFRNIARHIQQIKDSDAYLRTVGVGSLSPSEVELACKDRCISPNTASGAELRARLSEWLAIATDLDHNCTNKDNSLNVHNRRLILMGLEVAKDIGLEDDDWRNRLSSFFNRGTEGLVAIFKAMVNPK
jgi:hypothetical protein